MLRLLLIRSVRRCRFALTRIPPTQFTFSGALVIIQLAKSVIRLPVPFVTRIQSPVNSIQLFFCATISVVVTNCQLRSSFPILLTQTMLQRRQTFVTTGQSRFAILPLLRLRQLLDAIG